MPQSDDPSDSSSQLPYSIDLETPAEVDSLFESLADHRRRLVIECLSDRSCPIVVEELVQEVCRREVAESSDGTLGDERVEITIALIHNHLPKLNEAGVIEVDHLTSTVGEGDRFETAMTVLQVV